MIYHFQKKLNTSNDEYKFIIVFRNQISWFPSAYWTYVKSYGKNTYDNFVKESTSNNKCMYDIFYETYANRFGKENILPLLFEEFKSDAEKEIHKICEFCGQPDIQIDEREQKIINKRPSDAYIQVSNFLRHTIPKNNFPLRKKVLRACELSFLLLEKPFKMANIPLYKINYASQDELIKKTYARSNSRLQELTGLPLEKYGYPLG